MFEAIKTWILSNPELAIAIFTISGMTFLYTGMLITGLMLVKGKTYIVQEDGKSALVRHYPLTLIDSNGHRIWVKKTETDFFVETVHDIYPVGVKLMLSVNNTTLHFTHSKEGIIVHWGDDVRLPVRASEL